MLLVQPIFKDTATDIVLWSVFTADETFFASNSCRRLHVRCYPW